MGLIWENWASQRLPPLAETVVLDDGSFLAKITVP